MEIYVKKICRTWKKKLDLFALYTLDPLTLILKQYLLTNIVSQVAEASDVGNNITKFQERHELIKSVVMNQNCVHVLSHMQFNDSAKASSFLVIIFSLL